MKKFLLSAVIATSSFLATSAQSSILNNPDNHGYFGVRVAADITCPGSMSTKGRSVDAFSNGGGIEFGAIYNAPVAYNFYIEPGLKFYYDTYSGNDDVMKDLKVKKFGMRIPIMAGYHFDFTSDTKVYVFTGPELEIGLDGKESFKSGRTTYTNDAYGDDGNYNRANLLWGIGAGISYQHFYFGINGSLGMVNMLKDSDGVSLHENRVSISLGYNF